MKKITKNVIAMGVSTLLAGMAQAQEVVYEESAVDWQYSEYTDAGTAVPEQAVAYEQPSWQQAEQPAYEQSYEQTSAEYGQADAGYEYVSEQQPEQQPPVQANGGYDQYSYQDGVGDDYQASAYQPPVAQDDTQGYDQTYAQQAQTYEQYGQYNRQQPVYEQAPTPPPTPAPAQHAQLSPSLLGERLLTAARAGNLNDVRWLLRKGADPDYKTHENALSPLDLVVKGGWVDVAQVFQQEGVNFNKRGHLGITYLHQAAAAGKLPMVKFLVGAGVSPNTTTAKDWTALHHAARFGHAAVVDYLLAAGANSEHRNSDGFRPRELAINARHLQIAQMF